MNPPPSELSLPLLHPATACTFSAVADRSGAGPAGASGPGPGRVGRIVSANDAAEHVLFRATHGTARDGRSTAVPSGLFVFDDFTGGLEPGAFAVIAGAPGVGSTALALNWVRHAALDFGIPTGVVLLADSALETAARLLANGASVSATAIYRGILNREEHARLAGALETLRSSPLWLVETTDRSAAEVEAHIRALIHGHSVQLLLVDRVDLAAHRRPSRRTEDASALLARRLSALAAHHGVVAIATLRLAHATAHSPLDLGAVSAGAGAIEQNADLVLFVEKAPHERGSTHGRYSRRLRIARNRSGATGVVMVEFTPRFTRYSDITR